MDATRKRAVALALLVVFMILPAHALAADGGRTRSGQPDSISGFINADSLIKIGVGMLATLLFIVSALAYWRERRGKFLTIMLAFMFFMVKGLVGLIDYFFPAESPLLIPFSDAIDFIILFLFAVAVLKE